MNTLTFSVVTLALLGSGASIYAQSPSSDLSVGSDGSSSAMAVPARTEEQLDTLLGPIALYPDTLLAVILPASTLSSDVVLAARFLQANGRDAPIDSQGWDDSVKSLAHYPEIVAWMDENLAWTKQLGEAFAAQPAEVMKAIQRLRARARAVGTLKDSPQQKVAVDGDVIAIQPAETNVIYVPRYDPEVVYVERPYDYYSGPFISFGIGFPLVRSWNYGCDWRQSRVWVGPPRGSVVWHNTPGHIPIGAHPWVPPARHFNNSGIALMGERRESIERHEAVQRREVVRPIPFGRTPADDAAARVRNEHAIRPWNRAPEAANNPYRRPGAQTQPDQAAAEAAPAPRTDMLPSNDNRVRFRDRRDAEHHEVVPGEARSQPGVTLPASHVHSGQTQPTTSQPRSSSPAALPTATVSPGEDRAHVREHRGNERHDVLPGSVTVQPRASAPAANAAPASNVHSAPVQPNTTITHTYGPRPGPQPAVAPPARVQAPTPQAAPAPAAAPRQAAPAPAPAAEGAGRGGRVPPADGSDRGRARS